MQNEWLTSHLPRARTQFLQIDESPNPPSRRSLDWALLQKETYGERTSLEHRKWNDDLF